MDRKIERRFPKPVPVRIFLSFSHSNHIHRFNNSRLNNLSAFSTLKPPKFRFAQTDSIEIRSRQKVDLGSVLVKGSTPALTNPAAGAECQRLEPCAALVRGQDVGRVRGWSSGRHCRITGGGAPNDVIATAATTPT